MDVEEGDLFETERGKKGARNTETVVSEKSAEGSSRGERRAKPLL